MPSRPSRAAAAEAASKVKAAVVTEERGLEFICEAIEKQLESHELLVDAFDALSMVASFAPVAGMRLELLGFAQLLMLAMEAHEGDPRAHAKVVAAGASTVAQVLRGGRGALRQRHVRAVRRPATLAVLGACPALRGPVCGDVGVPPADAGLALLA